MFILSMFNRIPRSKNFFFTLSILFVLIITIYQLIKTNSELNKSLAMQTARAQGLNKLLNEFSLELVDAQISSGLPSTIPLSQKFCNSDNKLGIVIPHRNREAQLKIAIKWIRNHLLHQFSRLNSKYNRKDTNGNNDHDYNNNPNNNNNNQQQKPEQQEQLISEENLICSFVGFFVMEQANQKLFNKGVLLNAGSVIAHEHGANVIIFNDVDTLPTRNVDYLTVPSRPIQLSSEIDRFGFTAPYPKNAGGVDLLTFEHFKQINGLSNNYEGWGAEDDDFFQRIVLAGLIDDEEFMNRPPPGKGHFFTQVEELHTTRNKSNLENSKKYLTKMQTTGKDFWQDDGFSTLSYVVRNSTQIAEDVYHYMIEKA